MTAHEDLHGCDNWCSPAKSAVFRQIIEGRKLRVAGVLAQKTHGERLGSCRPGGRDRLASIARRAGPSGRESHGAAMVIMGNANGPPGADFRSETAESPRKH